MLGFKGSSIKGLKVSLKSGQLIVERELKWGVQVVVNRWSGTEGSDVTVSVFLPSVGQASAFTDGARCASQLTPDLLRSRRRKSSSDARAGRGHASREWILPKSFRATQGTTPHLGSGGAVWRRHQVRPPHSLLSPRRLLIALRSDTQALAIPPPDISLACFDPPPPNYLPSVPSTWVPAFVAPPARSTVYTLRKGSTQAKRTLGGGRPKKAFARASGFAPARAPSLRRSVGPSELGSVDGDESVERKRFPFRLLTCRSVLTMRRVPAAGFAPARAASSLPRSAGSSRLRAVESVEPVERKYLHLVLWLS